MHTETIVKWACRRIYTYNCAKRWSNRKKAFQRDHVSIRVEPLQWQYLPVGRNQFQFRAQQTQMQFYDGKISSSGHDQILSISQITSLTFERFTNMVRSLTFLLLFLSDTLWHASFSRVDAAGNVAEMSHENILC